VLPGLIDGHAHLGADRPANRRWVGSTQGKRPGHVPWAREITAATDLWAEAAAARAIGVTEVGIRTRSDVFF
jgi:imidazolonepropionase-like amidohydrolase